MAQDLALFGSSSNNALVLPKHLQQFANLGSNIPDRVTIPSLTYRGKQWAYTVNGERTLITKIDKDTGDETPLQIIRLSILNLAPRRGRAYYPGSFDPDQAAMPDCWSEDGLVPNPHASEPQCEKCDGCPMAVKGSRVTDNGKQVAACSQHRMLAVQLVSRLEVPPLRLKLAITSDFDKDKDLAASGWYSFQGLLDLCRARGVPHTSLMVVMAKFDPTKDYPKVIFKPERLLTDAEGAIVYARAASEEVQKLISSAWTPNGVDGEPVETAEAKPAAKPASTKPTASAVRPAAAKPAPAQEPDEAEEELDLPPATTKPAATKPVSTKPVSTKPTASAAKPVVTNPYNVGDEDDDLILPGEEAPAAAAAKPVVARQVTTPPTTKPKGPRTQPKPAPEPDLEEDDGYAVAATADTTGGQLDDILDSWDSE